VPNDDFVALDGGNLHSLGLKLDGTIVAWGDNSYGQCNVPAPNTDFVAFAGGTDRSLGLRSLSTTDVEELGPGDVPNAGRFTKLSLKPNPFNPFVEVTFETSVSGYVTMEICDVSGRRVRIVPLGVLRPGLHRARWDGRDASGFNMASGVYFVRLRGTAETSRAMKAVLVR
jgi:hypothetical protein